MSVSLMSESRDCLQITKEVRSGEYRLISFYLARQLVSVPFESAIALLFTVIVYFMIGFQTAAAKYFIFAATLLLVNLISEMVGFIMGVILKARLCFRQHLEHSPGTSTSLSCHQQTLWSTNAIPSSRSTSALDLHCGSQSGSCLNHHMAP